MVLADDAEAGARSIEQDSIEGTWEDVGVFPAIAASDYGVGDAQTIEVEFQGLETLFLEIVGKDTTSVLHQLRNVGGLSAWCCSKIQDPLASLWVECQHRKERRCTLQHIVTSQVLRRGSDRHLRLVDLDTDLAPFRKWVEVGTTLDQALREFFSPGLEGVGTDGERTLSFVRLEELDQLCRVEEVQKMINELVVVTIVTMQQTSQLFDIKLPRFSFTQPTDVHKDVDGLLDLEIDHTDIYGFIIRFALILEWRSIAVHVLIAFLCVLNIVLVLGSFLEFLVDLLIILLTVLLFLELFLVILVFFLRFSLDLSFFFR